MVDLVSRGTFIRFSQKLPTDVFKHTVNSNQDFCGIGINVSGPQLLDSCDELVIPSIFVFMVPWDWSTIATMQNHLVAIQL